MFHAKVEHEYAKLRTISRLRDSADREEFSLDKRGDVMRVEAPQNQEQFHDHQLQSEIQIAKYDRLARSFESQPRKAKDTHGQTRVLSLNNLTRPWKLDEAAPFKGVENPELLVRFSFNDTEPCYQNFARVFRFISQQVYFSLRAQYV
ncbi:unnamed protein product [Cylicocyclus nassatus]|uniref:Uncharacterized protein n=1 Tax=Cylicocyclus nassatus TaxID=53992 RepID=A0AA36H105_CYLNA|nr:unnamed protein product [Cylicocyclus nassatus]